METPTSTSERLLATVLPEDGQIPAFVHTDPDVYRLEHQRLWNRVWLFVAHESEIPSPGDFVVRDMGERNVIVARGDDGEIRVFLNSCRHRGMRLAVEDEGSGPSWRCSYHGFTFRNNGTFLGAPYQRAAYVEGLDRDSLRLLEATSDSYRGMVFATWNPHPEPLTDFLGGMAWYLDILIGRAEFEVVGAPQRWVVPTAWKLPAENFASDAYHTATTHAFLAKLGLVSGVDFGRLGYHVDVGQGHGLGIGIQDEGPWYPQELRPEYERNLTPDQLALMDRIKNFHGNVFPNLSFLIPNVVEIAGHRVTGMTVRLWQPIGPDSIQAWSWHLVEKGAPQWWKELGRKTYVQTFGSSGMFEQDDTENWEAQTRNSSATLNFEEPVMLHYQMGLGRQPLSGFPGPGTVYDGKFSEAAARSFYRRWLDLVVGDK
ncbi:aromatic ring-hydroxylating dioxygenase subunit alpha [Geodermatophilus sp. DSM 44513]|uniref:aromatic ring-hydroxylating dioxygenase subunit alpha n=1 Tax=Geodermatophilus sp. DSM 44513 TaxID=1528104 RepID=UPI001284DA8E|nr:aromatic ring-hydroxylating dioxygenase subunit alpha [Geodermatophilus sp. DSM 44513]WNV77099.1 aromatic ring-hydroxylating dioxygenase subunit alpha [Geodermatophilus sp. DSM 44513]